MAVSGTSLIQEAVKTITETGDPAANIAIRIVDREWPRAPKALRVLAARGLAAEIHDELGQMRAGRGAESGSENEASVGPRPASAPRIPTGWSRLWTTFYMGADGQEKPFMEFTVDDCAFIVTWATARIEGLSIVRRKAEKARAALGEYGAEHVKDLPLDVIRGIEEVE